MSDATPNADKPNSPLPAVLVAVAILAVAAVLIFWPNDDAVERETSANGGDAAMHDGARSPGIDGGAIPARDHDPAYRDKGQVSDAASSTPRRMLDAPPPEKVRTFASKAEEIAWYEDQRKKAQVILDMRKRALDRLADTPEEKIVDYERSRKVVEANLQDAERHLSEIETRLAALRGQ